MFQNIFPLIFQLVLLVRVLAQCELFLILIILKNLPSNLIDEAIIVLKPNKKIRKLERIEKNKSTSLEKEKKDNKYIIKEAEMIVNEYMEKVENKNKKEIFNKETNKKYKNIKKYAIITTIICAIQSLLLIIL